MDRIAGFHFPTELPGLEIDAVEDAYRIADEDGAISDGGFGGAGGLERESPLDDWGFRDGGVHPALESRAAAGDRPVC